ncbi:hypothetical protein [Flavilitoribacter nigricans]|uniref:DoxX family protein n=1 Tax=Flavilitoribacter nigricans (strain ATCC 23147 / DSM 23189 / NBRC 102662 / NCIMB 1420 / SS-2) TaxID=1122177 RepID=A0A2D0NGU8_FLAN2|nr:hypothetical protein [Flavilitoribacter nigricans]PHN07707.1 hypothetical protein CRP01_06295 [Flavilitoribacter nigricans DSM 23189 = NBRC 102662]
MENTLDPVYSVPWSVPKKIAFRFFFIFFLLFIIIQNNGAFPGWDILMKYPTELLHLFIPWVGEHILHLPEKITVFTNGSGDTRYDYVIVFTIFVLSVLGTVIWTLLDRKASDYDTLYYWLTVALRFYVGLMLISYGLVKVIKLQFPYPGFYRLTQPFGEASPMGLAWTFLGFSKGYNLFMGIAELAAGLLLFRRTMTFGAVITLMTAANVMAVNYFFDVPVKILSTALVTMSAFLLARDAERLFRFFFSGEAVKLPKIEIPPQLRKKGFRIARLVLKTLVIGYAVIYGAIKVNGYSRDFGENAPKPGLYGLYTVDTFIVNRDTLPPLKTDTLQWAQLQIEREGFARIKYMNDRSAGFVTTLDTTGRSLKFMKRDSSEQYSFIYELPDTNRLRLIGTMQEDTVAIVFKRLDKSDFLLLNRGFNWVNEYPFNR